MPESQDISNPSQNNENSDLMQRSGSFRSSLEEISASQDPEKYLRLNRSVRSTMGDLDDILSDPKATIPYETLRGFYDIYHSDDVSVRTAGHYFLNPLLRLDDRNPEPDRGKLWGEVSHDIASKLTAPRSEDDIQLASLLLDEASMFIKIMRKDDLLETCIRNINSELGAMLVYSQLSKLKGFEAMRQHMRELAKQDPELRKKYEFCERVAGITDPENPVYTSLGEVYDAVGDMKDYLPYSQTHEYELQLLESILPSEGKILDIGSGEGRLLTPLFKKGFDIIGLDLQPSVQNSEAPVIEGSWKDIPLSSSSLDAAYSLGRSITHNTTISNVAQFFGEINRVLKPEGIFIFDSPNLQKGDYKKNTSEFTTKASGQKILRFQKGSLHDGPVSTDTFDRLVLSENQIRALAKLCGFEVEIIGAHEFGAKDSPNENIYWRLKKREYVEKLSEGNSRLRLIEHLNDSRHQSMQD